MRKSCFLTSLAFGCGLFTMPKSSRCEWCVFCLSMDDKCLYELNSNITSDTTTIRIQFSEQRLAQLYETTMNMTANLTIDNCLIRESYLFGFPDKMTMNYTNQTIQESTLIVFGDAVEDDRLYRRRTFDENISPLDFFNSVRDEFKLNEVCVKYF